MSYKNEVLSTPPTSFLTAPGVRDSMLRFLSAATRENNVDNGWGCGAVGSAREWHSRGRRFNPGQLHHTALRVIRRLFIAFSWSIAGGETP